MAAELDAFKERMIKTTEVLATQFASVRAGRANAAVLDQISVDYYGVPTPIRQIASVSSPDARTLLIQPWDASALKGIEKAILTSELGINPQNDGRSIRLVFHNSRRSVARTWPSRFASTARKARWPSVTSGVTPWKNSRSSRKRPKSRRTT